jgi:hypothetical protein
MENKLINAPNQTINQFVHFQQLKGGDLNMAEENQSDEIATMCATKAGNGFKVVVNGVWYYASKKNVLDLTQGRIKSCVFSTIKDEQ